jgi:hypothetical protein
VESRKSLRQMSLLHNCPLKCSWRTSSNPEQYQNSLLLINIYKPQS